MINFDMVGGLVRHALTTFGGYLVAKGVLDEGTMMEAVGGLMAIIGVVWSLYQKKRAA